jgi:hypothetical protein
MSGRLCIVHRDRLDLFEELSREFRDVSDVQIVFDRRITDRRRTPAGTTGDRRRGERRQYRSDMRLLGWILTRQQDAAAMPLAEVV